MSITIPFLGLLTNMQSKYFHSLRTFCLLCSVSVVILANGCATVPDYAGTFIGRAEKVELHSLDGNTFPVTVFTVETTKGRISIRKGLTGGLSGLPESWGPNVLVDRHYVAYAPDRFAGRRLEVDGTMAIRRVFPFPGGPELFDILSNGRKERVRAVLVVRRIRIDNTAASQGGELNREVEPKK